MPKPESENSRIFGSPSVADGSKPKRHLPIATPHSLLAVDSNLVLIDSSLIIDFMGASG
jgi:hypothetical protein